MSNSSEEQNIVTLVKTDHRLVENLFNEYNSTNDLKKRKEIVNTIIKELCVHAATEEMWLYPKIRTLLANGNNEADHSIHEHREAKKILYELDSMEASNPKFDTLMQELISSILHHVKEEERDILDKLQKEVDLDTLTDLGKKWEQYKLIAPSRPHPDAPDKGMAAIAVNAATKPLDSARDMTRDMAEH